jgi:hypothetical protein
MTPLQALLVHLLLMRRAAVAAGMRPVGLVDLVEERVLAREGMVFHGLQAEMRRPTRDLAAEALVLHPAEGRLREAQAAPAWSSSLTPTRSLISPALAAL